MRRNGFVARVTTTSAARLTVLPEGARKVMEPCGYIRRIPSEANDASVVNGARASFGRHKTVLEPEDVRTPEEAEALNAETKPERPVQPGLVYRLFANQHYSPAEQHGILMYLDGAPLSILRYLPDEVDALPHEDLRDAVRFPWTPNFRHATTLYERAWRAGDEKAFAWASNVLHAFQEAGCNVALDAFERGSDAPAVVPHELPPGAAFRVVANGPAERHVLATIQAHVGGAERAPAELLDLAYAKHPNLLNLYVFSWQLRAIIHVFWDLVRHRKSSPNGESGRYSVLKDEWVALAPGDVRTQKGHPLSYERGVAAEDAARAFADDVNAFNAEGARLYRKHLDAGIAREQCSWFNTLATFRTFVWTFRGMGLANMLGLRNAPPALHELRLYAAEMEADVLKEAPHLHAAFLRHERRAA